MTLRFTLVEATITDTTIGWDIAGKPDVYVKLTVGSKTNTWPTKDNTFHPTWNTSFTWTDVTDSDIERVLFQFYDEDTFFDESIGDIYLDLTSYKSPSDQPKEFSMSSTFDYVTFYGRVLLTYPSGDECGGKTCATCSSSNACSSVAMNGQCWWHSSACYNRSYLCNGVTCETCNTSGACASDPDIAGECSWNTEKNTCYNHSQGKGNEPITYTDNGVTKTGYIVIDQQVRGSSSTADYKLGDAGVTVNGNSITQRFVTGENVGSRVYLLDATQKSYVKFKLIDAELSYDVEIDIPCGMNAALYTVEMPADGVTPGHTAGATYGGGYCDSNFVGGIGCAEFDISESNARATVYTAHGCSPTTGFGAKGSITCDATGTAANPYHADKGFYGTGSSFTINTAQKFTVATQFKGAGQQLTSVDRVYVQNGTRVKQPNNISGGKGLDQISPSLAAGHVLVFSLWASDGDMAWMDCNENGPCQSVNESLAYLKQNYPAASVTYSNIRYGPIDSTF